jgi:L-lactate dehydrogenase (cytochrome)
VVCDETPSGAAKAAFDYTDGAAEEELSPARARQAFRDIHFIRSVSRRPGSRG